MWTQPGSGHEGSFSQLGVTRLELLSSRITRGREAAVTPGSRVRFVPPVPFERDAGRWGQVWAPAQLRVLQQRI